MTQELKPCPFCGGKLSTAKDYDKDGFGYFLFYTCNGCGMKSSERYFSDSSSECPLSRSEMRDKVNTRPIEDALLTALEAITPKGDFSKDDWWCPQCQAAINCATSGERCPDCGTFLPDCQPTYKNVLTAQAAIAKAKGES